MHLLIALRAPSARILALSDQSLKVGWMGQNSALSIRLFNEQ